MKAWTFQDPKQLAKHGTKLCPWSVGWYDANGRRRAKTIGSKSMAEKYKRKKEGELANNLIDPMSNRTKWDELQRRYLEHVAARRAATTVEEYKRSLDTYHRIMRPVWVRDVTTESIDRFVTKRMAEKPDLSPASVNKDLRTVKAMMRKAATWKMATEVPVFEFLREFERDPDFITEEQFAALYEQCHTMKRPGGEHYDSADWWRALLALAYTTGWRIGQILELRKDNVDFANCTAFAVAENTKGKRDARVDLSPWAVDHLKVIAGFSPLMFPWPHHRRTLSADFERLKVAAGIDMPGLFHRLRYGFATNNAGNLEGQVLQRVMQHRSSATTARYINVAERMRKSDVASRILIPTVKKQNA